MHFLIKTNDPYKMLDDTIQQWNHDLYDILENFQHLYGQLYHDNHHPIQTGAFLDILVYYFLWNMCHCSNREDLHLDRYNIFY